MASWKHWLTGSMPALVPSIGCDKNSTKLTWGQIYSGSWLKGIVLVVKVWWGCRRLVCSCGDTEATWSHVRPESAAGIHFLPSAVPVHGMLPPTTWWGHKEGQGGPPPQLISSGDIVAGKAKGVPNSNTLGHFLSQPSWRDDMFCLQSQSCETGETNLSNGSFEIRATLATFYSKTIFLLKIIYHTSDWRLILDFPNSILPKLSLQYAWSSVSVWPGGQSWVKWHVIELRVFWWSPVC